MKHISLLLLLILPFLNLSAQEGQSPSDTLLDAKIGQLLKLSGAEAQFVSAIDQMITMQKANPVYKDILPESFWDDFSLEAHKTGYKELLPGMIAIYREQMTEAEIDHQITYFGSPVTQGIVAKQPALMQAAMAVGADWGRKVGEQIATKLQQAVEERN